MCVCLVCVECVWMCVCLVCVECVESVCVECVLSVCGCGSPDNAGRL